MARHLTLAIIKPHIIKERNVGKIIDLIERNDFAILLAKEIQLRPEGAREFYNEHRGKDFFDKLIYTMCSGPMWVLTLSKHDAVQEWRNLIGETDSAKAASGTIRNLFGNPTNITLNAVHGSKSDHDAIREIGFFFGREIDLARKVEELDTTKLIV